MGSPSTLLILTLSGTNLDFTWMTKNKRTWHVGCPNKSDMACVLVLDEVPSSVVLMTCPNMTCVDVKILEKVAPRRGCDLG